MKILSAVALAMALVAGSAQAVPTNPSFENGLLGWTPNGQVAVVSSYTAHDSFGNPVQMLPTNGSGFALVTPGTPTSSVTSAPFWVNAGNIFGFDWFFDANDYLPYNDSASASLNVFGSGTEILSVLLANVASVGNYGLTGWNTTELLVPYTGWVTFTGWASNRLDFALNSPTGFDNFWLIPEPTPVALVGLGLLGLAGLRRKTTAT